MGTLIGAKEIQQLMERMEKKELAKMCRAATRQSNNAISKPAYEQSAIAMVGGEMGSLIAKNLTVRAMTKMRRGQYGTQVILKEVDEFVHIDGNNKRHFIPAAIEYGHAFPGRGGGKNSPKDVPANPFAKTAYETNKERATRRTETLIWQNLQAFLRSNQVRRR